MAAIKFGWALLAALVAALALVACSPITALNALAPAGTHTRTADVAYGDGPRQKLDIYRPAQPAPTGGWPVVVFFYGGSWNSGARSDYAFVGEALAARGILTLVADYRLYPEVRYPDFLRDSAAALAWGLEHASPLGGNPRRVFVMGHSAGAYNAAMLALDARWLQGNPAGAHQPAELAGFIGLAGPYDFLPMTNEDTQPVFFHPNYPAGSQPVSHVSRTAPHLPGRRARRPPGRPAAQHPGPGESPAGAACPRDREDLRRRQPRHADRRLRRAVALAGPGAGRRRGLHPAHAAALISPPRPAARRSTPRHPSTPRPHHR